MIYTQSFILTRRFVEEVLGARNFRYTINTDGRWTMSCRTRYGEHMVFRLDPNRHTRPTGAPPPGDNDTIAAALLEEFPFLRYERERVNLRGFMQAGKSRAIMAILWFGMYRWNLRPIMCTLNMISSHNQMINRDIRDFNKWLSDHGENERILDIDDLRLSAGRLTTPRNKILFVMGNHVQLAKILASDDEKLIVVDEADTFIKNLDPIRDVSRAGRLFDDLLRGAVSIWMVTATPFALLNQKGIRARTVELPVCPTYRGLDMMKIIPVDDNEARRMQRNDAALTALIVRALMECDPEEKLPYRALLVNARHRIRDQARLARRLQEHGIHSFTLNSDSPCFVKEFVPAGDGGRPTDHATVSDLFNHFERVARTEGYRRYVVIACRTAGRAISFRPDDEDFHGGLAGQILIMSTPHMAQALQSLRCCGKYSEDYPEIRLYASSRLVRSMCAELYYNLFLWTLAGREYGESRLLIEGIRVVATGKHDRPAVDDVSLDERNKIINEEYPDLDAVTRAVRALGYKNERVMTRPNLLVVEPVDLSAMDQPGFHGNSRAALEIRRIVQERFPHHRPIYAWTADRWQGLHSITRRFRGNDLAYCPQHVAWPDKENNRVVIVEWKDGFYEPHVENGRERVHPFDDLFPLDDKETAFLYRTTHNTWRFYNRHEEMMIGDTGHSGR